MSRPNLFVKDVVLKTELINRDGVFTGVVLLDSSQESLCEEETRDPIRRRCATIEPIAEELESSEEIVDIASDWFQRWV